METTKIESLIEKYENAQTSIAEENELRTYFSSQNVASHLQEYKLVFEYYAVSKTDNLTSKISIQTKNKNTKWFAIAAAITLLLGIGTAVMMNDEPKLIANDLGTFQNPETAFIETQKALAMLSNHVNTGIESVNYVSEYQKSKERIFK